MGKPTGFLDYQRQQNKVKKPKFRLLDFEEFHIPLDEDKRRQQAARCMNCGVPFCLSAIKIDHMVTGCPLHNLIPEWNDEIYHHNDEIALSRLLKTNPFPEFTGRVCPALCEMACLCLKNGDAVTIQDNELFVIENAYDKGYMKASPPSVRTNKKVAVIGSGPSGLSVAYKLNQRGHHVTVYEKNDQIGGLLMYGIPQMKLDKACIKRRQNILEEEGIVFETNINVGKDISKEELLLKYDVIVVCCGTQKARRLNIDNEDVQGVYPAVDFLTQVTKGYLSKQHLDLKNKHVVVVGGGDTGNDCVGTCIRLGCASIIQLEMMPCPSVQNTNPWPMKSNSFKLDYGQEESLEVFHQDSRIFETTVEKLIVENHCLKAIQTMQGSLVDGKWQKKAHSEKVLSCDLLLIAAGFIGIDDDLKEQFDLKVTPHHTIQTAPSSHQTDNKKIFVAGDAHRGASLVVWAIKDGKDCAKEVDQYLMGYSYMNK